VRSRVTHAYAERSQPDEAIRQAHKSIGGFHDALGEVGRRLSTEQGRETQEEANARETLQQARGLDDEIAAIGEKIQQLEDNLNQQIQLIQTQSYSPSSGGSSLPTSTSQKNRTQPERRPKNRQAVARKKRIQREILKKKQEINNQKNRHKRLQQERQKLQSRVQHAKSVRRQYNERQKNLNQQINQIGGVRTRVNSAGNTLWFTIHLLQKLFYFSGRMTASHTRSNIQIPETLDDRLGVPLLSPFQLQWVRFWAERYKGSINDVESRLSNLRSLPDVDDVSLRTAQMYIQNSLAEIDSILSELVKAQAEFHDAKHAQQNARQKDRLIKLAAEHQERIRPFREYANKLLQWCDEIIIKQRESRTKKPQNSRCQLRLYALALAAADIKLLPEGTPSPEWEKTKLHVGTAYDLTPYCLKLFAYLVVLEERIAERLSAKEGIWIVREPRT
jgi:chromosome segregation ATPase